MVGKASVTFRGVCDSVGSVFCQIYYRTDRGWFSHYQNRCIPLRVSFSTYNSAVFCGRFNRFGRFETFFYFSDNTNTKIKSKNITNNFSQQPAIHKNIFQLILIKIILSYSLLNQAIRSNNEKANTIRKPQIKFNN